MGSSLTSYLLSAKGARAMGWYGCFRSHAFFSFSGISGADAAARETASAASRAFAARSS